MSDDNDGQVSAGRWGTVPEAALHFRKSTRTIERWVDVGRLKRHPTTQPMQVWIPDGQPSDTLSDTSDDTVRQFEAAEERALAIMERVSDVVGRQVAALSEQLTDALGRVESLARENGQKQERIEALERVLDVVRQMSDDERARADALAAQLAASERAREAAERRRWYDPRT